jgi:cytosine/adenosine deaminase-related metal-dependent hydrolase
MRFLIANPLLLAPVALLQASIASASSILFTGGTIISFDVATESLKVIRNGSLLVKDDRIVSVSASPLGDGSKPANTKVIDATNKIISPGFIDTHRHGWQTVFKTMASNTSLVEYFSRYGEFAAAGLFSAEEVYLSQLAGQLEAINAGVTSTLDHAHHTWSPETAEAGLTASIDSGGRVFWCYAFHNVTNYTIPEQLVDFRNLATKASFKGTATTLGVAYDSFSPNPNQQEIRNVVGLAKQVLPKPPLEAVSYNRSCGVSLN